jgi:hypothetical protein
MPLRSLARRAAPERARDAEVAAEVRRALAAGERLTPGRVQP